LAGLATVSEQSFRFTPEKAGSLLTRFARVCSSAAQEGSSIAERVAWARIVEDVRW